MEKTLLVQDIFIYPIKSLSGIRLTKAKVEEKGFAYDRRWMLVDQEGIFLSQRKHPELALFRVEIDGEALVVTYQKDGQSIHIPTNLATGPERIVTVWDDQMEAKAVHSDFDAWFSGILGFAVSLVQMPESTHRKVDPRYAVNGESVSFADGMPYLLIGQRSLDELNSRLEEPVPMNRFRPNIVFSGGSPYLEDSLRKIRIGEVDFEVVKPCARCVMTTVDQSTGIKGKEPLKTLSSYRTLNGKVYFGQNLIAVHSGEVSVGDVIRPI
jgi:uncharacterized protein YcbX